MKPSHESPPHEEDDAEGRCGEDTETGGDCTGPSCGSCQQQDGAPWALGLVLALAWGRWRRRRAS